MKRFRRLGFIRLLAALLVWATPAASLEAAVGAARDSAVHHESTTGAFSHLPGSAGEHGHEDGLPASEHRHGPSHQHGTGADHCSHAHSYCAVTTTLTPIAGQRGIAITSETSPLEAWFTLHEPPPPRA